MVSVIVPVYNTEQFLEECIQSIVNQTYQELEIIIINDGSTDGSGTICRKWERLDKRIKYIEKENEGQGAARNLGIQMATGEYIVFVDSDDYVDIDMIDKVYAYISRCKADICVYSHRHVYEGIREWSLEGKTKNTVNSRDNKEILGLMMPILWNKMFSAELVKNSNILMSNLMCEDLVFNAQLYVKANKICFLDIPFYNYRYMREGNFSTDCPRYYEVGQSINELNEIFYKNGDFKAYWVQLYELSFYMFKDILSRFKNKGEWRYFVKVEDRFDEFIKEYKNQLNNWFSGYLECSLQEKTYLLLGSYNLRVIIHSLLLDEEGLRKDYGFSSIISMMSDCPDIEMPIEAFCFKNIYRKRCVSQDIEKTFCKNENFQDIDYVVVDLLDEVVDLIKMNEHCYITNSEFVKESGLYELENGKRVSFCSEERRTLFLKYAPQFAEKIKLQNIPVVVVKNFLCERHSIYYDVFEEYQNVEEIRRVNLELEWCYQQLLHYLPEAIVVDSSEFKELEFTHDDFPFGCKPVYYNTGYYQRMAIEIGRCIRKANLDDGS